MPLKKFTSNDIFYNTIQTYPHVQLDIYESIVYYQNVRGPITGAFTASVPCVPPGYISLYELNVDRSDTETGLIYPFIVKNGTLSNFKTISTSEFVEGFQYGDIISSSYPLSASISREYWQVGEGVLTASSDGAVDFTAGHPRRHLLALQNTLDYYKFLSPHYAFSSSLGDKGSQEISLISIPSIFYGTAIQKGSVDLQFYISGSLVGRLQDSKQNGELIQTGPGFTNTKSIKWESDAGLNSGCLRTAAPAIQDMLRGAGTGVYSISMWLYIPSATAPYGGTVLYANNGGSDQTHIRMMPGGDILFHIFWFPTSLSATLTTSGYPQDEWFHLAMTYDTTSTEMPLIYVNTVLQTLTSTITPSGALVAIVDFCRFGSKVGTSQVFNGSIDEPSFWDKILTLTEIQEIYNNNNTTDLNCHSAKENIISWWRMGDDAKDSVLNTEFVYDQINSNNLESIASAPLAMSLVDEVANVPTGPVCPINRVAGVVLYNEGFFVLTGSWALESPGITRLYRGLGSPVASSWLFYGAGMSGYETPSGAPLATDAIPYASFRMLFSGSQVIPTVTMFAHADKAEFNYSNNPTYLVHSQSMQAATGTYTYLEPELDIKNTVLTPYPDPTGSFEKITYISKIGIYDEMGNLIGIASTATPVKKTQMVDYTFKLKLDF